MQASNRGVEAMEQADFARAEEFFGQALQLRPDDADARFYLGVIALRGQRPAVAVPHLRASALVDATRPDVHLNLARALYDQKRPEEALTALKTLFVLDPSHPNGHLLAARIALDLGQRKVADQALRAAILGDPGFAPAYQLLAQLYVDVGAFEAAREVLQEGLRFTPDAVELQEALGLCWLDLGKPERAKSVFAQAADHPRARPALFLNQAAALLQLGERDGAMRALRAYLIQAQGQGDEASVQAAAKVLIKLKSGK